MWLIDEDTQSFGARVGSHRGFPQAYLQLLKFISQVRAPSTLAACMKSLSQHGDTTSICSGTPCLGYWSPTISFTPETVQIPTARDGRSAGSCSVGSVFSENELHPCSASGVAWWPLNQHLSPWSTEIRLQSGRTSAPTDDLLFYLEQGQAWRSVGTWLLELNHSPALRRAGISLPPPPATWDFMACLDHFRLILPLTFSIYFPLVQTSDAVPGPLQHMWWRLFTCAHWTQPRPHCRSPLPPSMSHLPCVSSFWDLPTEPWVSHTKILYSWSLSLPSFVPDDAQAAIQGRGEKQQLPHCLSLLLSL